MSAVSIKKRSKDLLVSHFFFSVFGQSAGEFPLRATL